MSQEIERIIPQYAQVAAEARRAFDPYIAEAQISEITTKEAHGVVETTVIYLRDGRVHETIYDETTKKLLGGSEPAVIEAVIAVLPDEGQRVVRAGGTIRKLKIKHDDRDDREYVHVHYVFADGLITSRKLELDGSDKR